VFEACFSVFAEGPGACRIVRLLEDVGAFDGAEFRSLFEEQRDPLYRFLFRLTRHAPDAEDLLQETFLTVWRKRELFEGRGSPAGYLRRTAYRLFLNARELEARRARLAPRIATDGIATELDGELERPEALERRETISFLAERVREALDDLPEPARQAFVLFRYEGLSCAEIASLAGAPVKTIETRLARATRMIGQRLRPYRHHATSL
jgi:RNA polymerase sigma-70 factor (ECF subfamily)